MSQAWLLNLGSGLLVAVNTSELVHLMYAPLAFPVPNTPAHASQVVDWNGTLLPLFDLPHWLLGEPGEKNMNVVGVIASHGDGTAPVAYAALRLTVPPIRVGVEDVQACDLPLPVEHWQVISLACFEHGGLPVPILDTQRLTNAVLPARSA